MARIEGVNLPSQKRIEYGLTYIYGIGLKSSQENLSVLNINLTLLLFDYSLESLGNLLINNPHSVLPDASLNSAPWPLREANQFNPHPRTP